jgi:nitrate reductase delta subunit
MVVSFKALALLLTYPTADLQAAAPVALAAVAEEGLISAAIQRSLARLVADLADGDLYDLQERYTDLFDRTRSLSLNLFEHVHGESRDRGEAMVTLLELYRANGLELSANELPDYLPVFLEYLSTRPKEEAASLIGEASHVLEAMAERLKQRNSPYRAVFAAMAELAGERADPAALAALLSEPAEDPDDLEAIDNAWAETAVTFGPSEVGCPKAEAIVGAMMAEPGVRPRRARAAV